MRRTGGFAWRAALATVAVAAGAAAVATAQDKAPILHEDLPAPGGPDPSPLIGDDPVAGKNPDAFAAGDKMLPEPEMNGREAGEPVFGRDGFATDRMTEDRPDYNTGSDGTLHYVSVFNPDVMPFKRMSALDTVASDYRAILRDPSTRIDRPVGGATDRSRDRFWGSLMIDLSSGKPVAIPSVAPDMRILSYETQPTVSLIFSKDGADNFYVRSDDRGAHGQVRLVFLADADAGYFAPSLPTRDYSLAEVRRRAQLENLLPTLPPEVEAAGRRGLRVLDIDPAHDELGEAFNKLVAYHRAFEAKPIPHPTGDIYWDLFENQAGVCRHRSATFLVTALAAGIPTRMVTNEAHAFVEVWFPDRGWQRIDLGGAALEMQVSNAEDKSIHRPRADDPFPKPKQYDQGYTRLEGKIGGLSANQLDDAHKKPGDGPASGDFGTLDDDGSGDGSGSGSGAFDDIVTPGRGARTADPDKITPTVLITTADTQGYRGETLHVEGRVDARGGPVPGVRVDVLLAPAGRGGEDAIVVGRGATASDGTFATDAQLPLELELRDYELYVTTREDQRYNGASSD
ncbi:MAG TPA: transglutaminase domain-containing protein [Kofleriaceae bacterium]|nr:transglutaminase domain-containing protein [Kofleriaceae bacterium]